MYLEPEQMDKPQIEQAILNIMAEKAAQGGSGKFWDNEIARLEETHKTAPDKNVLIASDGTLLQNEVISDDSSDNSVIGINTILHASSDPGNGDAMRFIVYNDADYKTTDVSVYVDEHGNIHTLNPRSCSHISFERNGYQLFRLDVIGGTQLADVTELSLTGGQTEHSALALTPTEARAKVETLMQELGLNDFIVDRIMLFSDAERLAYEAEPITDTNSTIPPVDNKKADENTPMCLILLEQYRGFRSHPHLASPKPVWKRWALVKNGIMNT